VPEIRCVDVDGGQLGILPTGKALKLAQQLGLDLVEISPTAKPPVCRIMDYGKFKFEQEKKKKEAKKSSVQIKLKEIKFHVNVAENDYDTKLRHARDFLAEGNRVKGSLFFRGRENAHRELGFEVMKRFVNDLANVAKVEQTPQLQGRQIACILVPLKKKQ